MRVVRLHLMYQCMYYEYTEKEAAVTMKIMHATMAEHTIYHSSKFQDLCWTKGSWEILWKFAVLLEWISVSHQGIISTEIIFFKNE